MKIRNMLDSRLSFEWGEDLIFIEVINPSIVYRGLCALTTWGIAWAFVESLI